MWRQYNPNPQGLIVGDCTVRAICAVTGRDWSNVHRDLCALARKMADMPSSDRVWWEFLRLNGFRRHKMIDRCPDCYTVADFAADHPRGIYVLGPHEHAVALIDGDWWDSWDSGNTVPTYFLRRD
jgi:hypothetical protein